MMGVPETWAASRTLAHVSKIEGTLEMQHSRLMQGSANFCQGPERKHFGLAVQVASVAITQLSCCSLDCSPEVATGTG